MRSFSALHLAAASVSLFHSSSVDSPSSNASAISRICRSTENIVSPSLDLTLSAVIPEMASVMNGISSGFSDSGTSTSDSSLSVPPCAFTYSTAPAKLLKLVVEPFTVTSASPLAANTDSGTMENTMMTVSRTERARFSHADPVFILILLYTHCANAADKRSVARGFS